MKYCPTSTVVRNPASVQNLLTLSCCDNFSIRCLYLCNWSSSCAGSSVKGMFVFITLGTNNGLDCPSTRSLSLFYHGKRHFCDCSVKTELIYRNKCAKNSFNRSWLGASSVLTIFHHLCSKALLWTMDSCIGRLVVCFLQMSTSFALHFCPILLVDCLHWWSTNFSLIQVREMTIVLLQISLHRQRRVEHLTRILFCCL